MKNKNIKLITRREFLRISGICLGGLAIAGLPSCLTGNSIKYSASSFFDLKSLTDVLTKGHCAPSIMSTLLDYLHKQDDSIVRLTSGLPGGMGLGLECGGITSPIMVLGLKYGFDYKQDVIPDVIKIGINHLKVFNNIHKSIKCADIINKKNGCKNVIATAPRICLYCMKENKKLTRMDNQTKAAFINILDYIHKNLFHCTHSVLMNLKDKILINENILKASWGFVGGTLLQNQTCGALTGGVFAISSKFGDIEKSFRRVMKLMKMRDKGENVESEDLNKFHKAMNISKKFGEWFRGNFGSVQCKDLIQCDFSSIQDVETYKLNNKIKICKKITDEVVKKLKIMLS